MNITCDRAALRDALSAVAHAIPARSSKPILENVCLVAADDALEVLGTDLEVSIRYRVEGVSVDEPGAALVPARVMADFVRDLSSETVSVRAAGPHCTVSGGSDSCELVTADAEEFPVVGRVTGSVAIQAEALSRLIGLTAFAAARDAGRYAIHGVLVEIGGGVLRMVATDGRRLATASVDTDGPDSTAIVPSKALALMGRLAEGAVALAFGENQLGMAAGSVEVLARLIDGEFPRYADVIPEETGHVMDAPADLLAQKLRLVANVTGDDARAVRLRLSPGRLELFGQSSGRGEATASMEVAYAGEPVDWAANPDYVIEGLKKAEGEVRLAFGGKTSPGRWTLGEGAVYVVMPITLDT